MGRRAKGIFAFVCLFCPLAFALCSSTAKRANIKMTLLPYLICPQKPCIYGGFTIKAKKANTKLLFREIVYILYRIGG